MLLLLALACDKDGTSADDTATTTDDTSTNGDTSSSDDSGGTSDTSDPFKDSPIIQSCDAFCYFHDTGDQFYNWRIECSVSDPQGVENVWNGTVDITQGNNSIATELVACDAAGFCSTTFREELYGVYCSQASSYDFFIRIQDWDENLSKPYKVTGRQQ